MAFTSFLGSGRIEGNIVKGTISPSLRFMPPHYVTVCLSTVCLWTERDATPKLFRMQQVLLALGKRMRELRAKQRFSQEAFADHRGLHRVAVGLIENGKRVPSLRTLLTISTGFGVTLSDLLRGIDKGMPSKNRHS